MLFQSNTTALLNIALFIKISNIVTKTLLKNSRLPKSLKKFYIHILVPLLLSIIFWYPLFLSLNHTGINIASYVALIIFTYLAKFIINYKSYKRFLLMSTITILLIVVFSLLHNNHYILVSIYYIISVFIFLKLDRRLSLAFGFFVGAVGFYWIPLSFRFFDITILIPFAVMLIGLTCSAIFFLLMYFNHTIFRILTLLLLAFLHPIGFNWLNINYFSAFSIFSPTLTSLACIAFSIYFMSFKGYKLIMALVMLLSFDYNFFTLDSKIASKIYLAQTNVAQNEKWNNNNIQNIINENFNYINEAILLGKKMVLLPETAFPFVMLESNFDNNTQSPIIPHLKSLSEKITIVAGGLRSENGAIFNTNFIFSDNDFSYIDKVKLVPFGETLPFKDVLENKWPFSFIYSMLARFGLDFNMKSARTYKSFMVNIDLESKKLDNIILRELDSKNHPNSSVKNENHLNSTNQQSLNVVNAICYEAASQEPYSILKTEENLADYLEYGLIRNKNVKYMVANSNNAWFAPSIQEQFQKMIIKYYARHYNYYIFHSANATQSYTISPNNGVD